MTMCGWRPWDRPCSSLPDEKAGVPMAEAAAAGKRGPCCTLGSLAELRQVAMALAGGWAAAATEKGRAVVTVPMGGQYVLPAIRIDEYVRHRAR